ncbi:MAG TPA: hypothetical protein VES97_00575 [Solirubrobacteraceae bacterium]|nr:hypothetical protein [Solirubrobacteraceae bacterium]
MWILAAGLVCACLPAVAQAGQSVRLHATLTPERLGQGTTVGFSIQILAPRGRVPSPVTSIDLSYPGELGIALSGLGLDTCGLKALEAFGLGACPADSRMGYGRALAEIPIGPAIVHEYARVAIVRAPVQEGHIALIFYVDGTSPVYAQLTLPALLLTASPPFGGRVSIDLPLVPSVPEASDVALVELRGTLGPQHLTYYERVRGRLVPYRPKGIALPGNCPRGGFPFLAAFAFLDGTRATARSAVPCPRRGR